MSASCNGNSNKRIAAHHQWRWVAADDSIRSVAFLCLIACSIPFSAFYYLLVASLTRESLFIIQTVEMVINGGRRQTDMAWHGVVLEAAWLQLRSHKDRKD